MCTVNNTEIYLRRPPVPAPRHAVAPLRRLHLHLRRRRRLASSPLALLLLLLLLLKIQN